MMTQLWSWLQGAVEYGGLTGSQAVRGRGGPGGQPITAWAADHQTAVLAAAAGLLLIILIAASRR